MAGKHMNVSVGAPIFLSEEEHAKYQATGVMPGEESSPVPVVRPQTITIEPSTTEVASEGIQAPSKDESANSDDPVPKTEIKAAPDPEHLHVAGQVYAVVSMVVPPRSTNMALKVRGVFADEATASDHARKLMDADPYFDIFVVSMYNWLVLPLPDDIRGEIRHRYADERLDKIMEKYHSDRVKYKNFNEQRIKETKEAGMRGDAGPMQIDVAKPTTVTIESSSMEVVRDEEEEGSQPHNMQPVEGIDTPPA